MPEERLALVARLFVAPEVRGFGLGRMLWRHAVAQAAERGRRAVAQAAERGRRAVLDAGQTLLSAVALYDAEGWERIGELHLPFDPDPPGSAATCR